MQIICLTPCGFIFVNFDNFANSKYSLYDSIYDFFYETCSHLVTVLISATKAKQSLTSAQSLMSTIALCLLVRCCRLVIYSEYMLRCEIHAASGESL